MAHASIETERLILRPFRLEDIPLVHTSLDSDPEVKRYTGGICSYERTEAYFRRVVEASARDPESLVRWAVLHKQEDRLIGWCGLQPLYFEATRVELGYGLATAYWGQGLATEAARAMLHRGFSLLRLESIVAVVDPENTASIRVLERCGMRCEGLVNDGSEREVLLYTLTPGDVSQPGGGRSRWGYRPLSRLLTDEP